MESATQVYVNSSVDYIPKDRKTVHRILDGRANLIWGIHVVDGLLRIGDFLVLASY